MTLQPVPIIALKSGLQTNKKPMLIANDAWSVIENAYAWRDRVLKREGNRYIGRLERLLTDQALGTTVSMSTSFSGNIVSILSLESTAEIQPLMSGAGVPGIIITVGTPDNATFTDLGNGNFSVTGLGVALGSYINYATGDFVLQFSAPLTGGGAITADFGYYPTLPCMGISQYNLPQLNDQQTIWFDEKYAYSYNGDTFQEFITGTTWDGGNSDFFWAYNYRGAGPQDKLLFVTNFVNNAGSPMRYTDGSSWTTFAPAVTASVNLYQARILIAYYGRLLAFNTWEGTSIGAAVNIQNRCRFSQQGTPISSTAWRTDIFGAGGLIDAPTTEAITGASFIRNNLIVDFETTTWQLRYVGEYGIPFIWERVSADFGSESTFSGVLFDNYRLSIGDTAIISANSNEVQRIDLDIPDQVFNFQNQNEGTVRIQGIRDYQKEIVYWCYADSNTQAAPGVNTTFPNYVMVYNYRTGSWSIFRDNITAFGNFQLMDAITWDSLTVTWDDTEITWDDFDTQALFPSIVIGNAQGFIHEYASTSSQDAYADKSAATQASLTVHAISLTSDDVVITSPNHNLQDGEIIRLDNLLFLDPTNNYAPIATDLNFDNTLQQYYEVSVLTANTFQIAKWNGTNYAMDFSFTPTNTALYVGNGVITLVPILNITTRDINIFQLQGMMTKMSRLEFLMGTTLQSAMTVNLFLNSNASDTPDFGGNMSTATQQTSTTPQMDDYNWFRFYATLSAQYFKINITYSDFLINMLSTHEESWVLYAINAWVSRGGKIV